MSSDEQVELWAAGEPRHNRDRDECCPDFSCCQPEYLAPEKERQKFLELWRDRENNGDADEALLYGYLGRALAAMGTEKDVYVGGDPANYERIQ